MTEFFLRADVTVLGPFSGAELREAAMGGAIGPESLVGASREGPWHRGQDIGLFADDQSALPHPGGTPTPSYQLRDPYGTATGPWPLRELIGRATKGVISPDDWVCADQGGQWVTVAQVPILQACCDQKLAVVSSSGELVPIIANQTGQPAQDHAAVHPGADGVSAVERAREQAHQRRRESRAKFVGRLLRRTATAAALVAVISAALIWVFFPRTTSLSSVIGRWTEDRTQDANTQGNWPLSVLLTDAGKIVIRDRAGGVSCGDFVWTDFQADDGLIAENDSDRFQANHLEKTVHDSDLSDLVQSTDGHIRLAGSAGSTLKLDGRAIKELFLRRDRDNLLVGYLLDIQADEGQPVIRAGWISLVADLRDGGLLERDLQQLPEKRCEAPELRGRRTAPHVSRAIVLAREGIKVELAGESQWMHRSRAESQQVTREWVLKTYGTPDEARIIEDPELLANARQDQKWLAGGSWLRYRQLRLDFSSQGNLLAVSIVKNDAEDDEDKNDR